MRPDLAVDNKADQTEGDTELMGKLRVGDTTGSIPLPYGLDRFFCEFGAAMTLATSRGLRMGMATIALTSAAFRVLVGAIVLTKNTLAAGSSLLDTVGIVVLNRAKEQVRRADARRVVAPMADEDTLGNGAVVHFPRHAVSAELFAKQVKQPITVRTTITNPYPAPIRSIIGFLNTLPETIVIHSGILLSKA